MDRRALPGLLAGLAGLGFGLAAASLGIPIFATTAAGCSLGAGLCAFVVVQRAVEAEAEAQSAIELMMARELEHNVIAKDSAVIDAETDLPGKRFFELAVKGRVASARRHLWPVSVVLLEVSFSDDAKQDNERTAALRSFIGLMHQTLREADIACRVGPTTFGLVLEDTAEEGGVWTAERLQIALAKDVAQINQLAAGVATYPTHALGADDVLKRAHTALARASAMVSSHGLGQVEVAHVDLS